MKLLIVLSSITFYSLSGSANWTTPLVDYYEGKSTETCVFNVDGKGSGPGLNPLLDINIWGNFSVTTWASFSGGKLRLDAVVFPNNFGEDSSGVGFGFLSGGGVFIPGNIPERLHSVQGFNISLTDLSSHRYAKEKFRKTTLVKDGRNWVPFFNQISSRNGKRHRLSNGVSYTGDPSWIYSRSREMRSGSPLTTLSSEGTRWTNGMRHPAIKDPLSRAQSLNFAQLEIIALVIPRFLPAILGTSNQPMTFYYAERRRGTLPMTFRFSGKSSEGWNRYSVTGKTPSRKEGDKGGRETTHGEFVVNPENSRQFRIAGTQIALDKYIMRLNSTGAATCEFN